MVIITTIQVSDRTVPYQGCKMLYSQNRCLSRNAMLTVRPSSLRPDVTASNPQTWS